MNDDEEGCDPSLESKYVGLSAEYQDIIKALEEIEGLGGEQFTHGPFSPADLVRALGGVLGEQQTEIERLKEKCGEVERCTRCLQPLTNQGLCKGEDRPHLAPIPPRVSALDVFRKK